MSYNQPSVSDFKVQFRRDFPYAVPAAGGAGNVTKVAGVITAIAVAAGGWGYSKAPTVTVKDKNGTGAVITTTVSEGAITSFVVGNGGTGYSDPSLVISGGAGSNSDLKRVIDDDIDGAFQDASFNMNEGLFSSQSEFSRAFNYLSAHMLVEKLLASGEGLASQYNWLTQSKTVGDISESFQIPDRILKDPMLAGFSKTRYGAMFLSIISPLLIGNMATQFRQSLP